MRRSVLAASVWAGLCGAALAQSTVPDAPVPPPAPAATREAAPAASEHADMREMLSVLREIAKTNREGVDYSRVQPDLLTQILTKLDKIEDKLDRIDTKLGEQGRPRRR